LKYSERHSRLFYLHKILLGLMLLLAASAEAKTVRVDKTGTVTSLSQAVQLSESGLLLWSVRDCTVNQMLPSTED